MDSSINPITIGVFIFMGVWLGIVSFLLYRTIAHYNKLTKGTDRHSLQSILNDLLKDVQVSKRNMRDLTNRISDQEALSDFSIQKISLMRFNPFSDTGGEQSFIIGLLDNKNSGILLTSLQGRSGTRWYAKQIKDNKGVKYDLSKEEAEAVKQAKPLT